MRHCAVSKSALLCGALFFRNQLARTFAALAACALLLTAIPALAQDEDFLRPATPLPMGRAFHGAAVLKNYLYVFGGSVQADVSSLVSGTLTHVARIEPNGSLSRFVATTPMPVARHYINNSTVVLNDTVYVVGGSDAILNGNRLNTVIYSKPMSNGMLEPWRESAPLDMIAVTGGAAFTTPGYIHVSGGRPFDSPPAASVYSCRLRADGSLGAWEPSSPLPKGLWFHHSAVGGGRVYVWGGLPENWTESKDIRGETGIYSAPILGNGRLGPWRTEQVRLPQGFYAASVSIAGPYVFSICPRYDGAEYSNDIWWTMVTPEGMKPWSKRPTPLPIKVQHAAATDYRRGLIFVPGGKASFEAPPGPITAMIRLSPKAQAWAESLWLQQEAAHRNSVTTRQLFADDPAAGAAEAVASPASASPQLPGFMDLNQGREQARSQRQALLVYFGTPDAQISREQDAVLSQASLNQVRSKAVLSYVNVKVSPQEAQQYGVFRVPTWIAYDTQNKEVAREVGVCTLKELEGLVGQVKG